jgi:hypothetical protein
MAATPAGAQALPPASPEIEGLLTSVDPARLESDLQRLVAFHTRHSNSSTSSRTRGIGAARTWVHERFSAAGNGAPGTIEATFHEFAATICRETKRHSNVAATLPGVGVPARRIVVVAHLDSRNDDGCDAKGRAPGANDDGSGVVLLLALADGLAAAVADGLRLEASVTLLAVVGEEQGLHGSTAWAQEAAAEGLRIDAAFGVDTVGDPTGCADPACPRGEPRREGSNQVRIFSEGPSTSAHRALSRTLRRQVRRHLDDLDPLLIPARDRPGRGGDHLAFQRNGFAATRWIETWETGDGSGRNGRQHNAEDTIDFVDFDYLARITRGALAVVADLALAPPAPEAPMAEARQDGTLRLRWPSGQGSAQVAGYRVAWRAAAEASSQDGALDHEGWIDAGMDMLPGPIQAPEAQQVFDLAGLTPDQPYWLSILAHDTAGNESAWSPETRAVAQRPVPSATPSITPSPPATSTATALPSATATSSTAHHVFMPTGLR